MWSLGYLFVGKNFLGSRGLDWRSLALLSGRRCTDGGQVHGVVLLNEGIVVGVAHKVIFLFGL